LKKDENGNYSMEDLYNLLVCYKWETKSVVKWNWSNKKK
jgi:hypothetical protein